MASVPSMKPPAKLAVAQDWWTLRERCLPGQALRITEVRETLTAKCEAGVTAKSLAALGDRP